MNVWLLELEAHEQRYTKEWHEHLPSQLTHAATERGLHDLMVHVVGGDLSEQVTSPGAFLNFAGTNVFKCSQIIRMASAFQAGKVRPGDKVLFTDAWHPGVIQVRYMSDLLDVPVQIHALWHSGSYDPWDFLGRKIVNKDWSLAFERAVFNAVDFNYFATEFHIRLFQSGLGREGRTKTIRTGWPMEYLEHALSPHSALPKRDLVLFPHRIAPEKQVEIFRDLGRHFPGYEFLVCQEKPLTKSEYHALLGQARMVFSANLQETLGISLYEGALCGAMPLAPNRLSYTEMYPAEWLYPSEWTEDWSNYERNRSRLVGRMAEMLARQQQALAEVNASLKNLTTRVGARFFSADDLYETLLGSFTAAGRTTAIPTVASTRTPEPYHLSDVV